MIVNLNEEKKSTDINDEFSEMIAKAFGND